MLIFQYICVLWFSYTICRNVYKVAVEKNLNNYQMVFLFFLVYIPFMSLLMFAGTFNKILGWPI